MIHRILALVRVATAATIGAGLLAGLSTAQTAEFSGARAQGQAQLPNPYRLVDNQFVLPDGRKMGSTSGVAIDRDGSSVWVVERCGGGSGALACVESNVGPLLQFDSSGKLLKSLGAGMFGTPHGVHVDREGNVWVADGNGKGSKGHQVVKFSPENKRLMTLGTPGVAGDGRDTFNQPSAVLVAPSGDIFVGDGHGGNSNARIVKFSKDGTFIKTWGKKGAGPGEFETPHHLAMDSRGRLFVADRGNNRIQIFDQDGNFIAQWSQFGRPNSIYIDKNDILYVADSQSDVRTNPGFVKGIRIGRATDGQVTALITDPEPDGIGEGIAVDSNGNIYTALTDKQTVRRYVRK